MMVKGTYKKKMFSENVYLLVFEPTSKAEDIVNGLMAIIEGKETSLKVKNREYEGIVTLNKTTIQFDIENISIKYEYGQTSKKSPLVAYMQAFEKVLKMNYEKQETLPIRYCNNLHRGGRENGTRVDARLLITRQRYTEDDTEE